MAADRPSAHVGGRALPALRVGHGPRAPEPDAVHRMVGSHRDLHQLRRAHEKCPAASACPDPRRTHDGSERRRALAQPAPETKGLFRRGGVWFATLALSAILVAIVLVANPHSSAPNPLTVPAAAIDPWLVDDCVSGTPQLGRVDCDQPHDGRIVQRVAHPRRVPGRDRRVRQARHRLQQRLLHRHRRVAGHRAETCSRTPKGCRRAEQ